MGIHYKICSTVLHVSNVNSKMWGREDNQPVAAWEIGTWAWGWLLGAHSGPTFGSNASTCMVSLKNVSASQPSSSIARNSSQGDKDDVSKAVATGILVATLSIVAKNCKRQMYENTALVKEIVLS
jgi:hypothetical protein